MRYLLLLLIIYLVIGLIRHLLKRTVSAAPKEDIKDKASRCRELLGLENAYSKQDLKARYHEKLKEYHPDKFQNQPEWVKKQAAEMTRKLIEAYEYLK